MESFLGRLFFISLSFLITSDKLLHMQTVKSADEHLHNYADNEVYWLALQSLHMQTIKSADEHLHMQIMKSADLLFSHYTCRQLSLLMSTYICRYWSPLTCSSVITHADNFIHWCTLQLLHLQGSMSADTHFRLYACRQWSLLNLHQLFYMQTIKSADVHFNYYTCRQLSPPM